MKSILKSYFQNELIEAGCDEAGRGCLAGPVFAAAVILPADFYHPLLNDSKKVNEHHREVLRPIIQQQAISWAVASVSHKEIDKINILNASFLAMHRALDKLELTPSLLLIDGNRFKAYRNIPHQCIISGDALYASIAAASILAKTYRDDYMNKLHKKYPDYHWKDNKGYGTLKHRQAIRELGSSPVHRQSFRLLPVEADTVNTDVSIIS
ncbi:MAG: ribonuclease HII [Bacteroidia bacterium]|nr:ribonuclease HII [Bacteroidia bacterium]